MFSVCLCAVFSVCVCRYDWSPLQHPPHTCAMRSAPQCSRHTRCHLLRLVCSAPALNYIFSSRKTCFEGLVAYPCLCMFGCCLKSAACATSCHSACARGLLPLGAARRSRCNIPTACLLKEYALYIRGAWPAGSGGAAAVAFVARAAAACRGDGTGGAVIAAVTAAYCALRAATATATGAAHTAHTAARSSSSSSSTYARLH